MTGPLLTVAQAAERLGLQPPRVLSLIHAGELRASDVSLKPGGKPQWRIQREDLDGFIARRTRQPVAPRRRRRKSVNVKRSF